MKSSFVDYLKYRALRFAPKDAGLIVDEPSRLEELPRHEIFAGGEAGTNWPDYCPPFRYQGGTMYCTAYTATSIGALFEKLSNKRDVEFSPAELFHREPYNGSINGNYLLKAAAAARQGFVFESDVKTIIPDYWNSGTFDELRKASKATPEQLERGKEFRVKDYAVVQPDRFSLMQALQASPISIAIPIGGGYWNNVAPNPTRISAWHNVMLVGFTREGDYLIYDSLTYKQGFDGFHVLSKDYQITYAMSFIDLPNEWKEKQEEVLKVENGALQHYGKRRSLTLEQNTAIRLRAELEKHPTLQGYFGQNWTICVNAVSYGGYTLQDLLNHFTSIRRGWGAIWNLDKVREEGRI